MNGDLLSAKINKKGGCAKKLSLKVYDIVPYMSTGVLFSSKEIEMSQIRILLLPARA